MDNMRSTYVDLYRIIPTFQELEKEVQALKDRWPKGKIIWWISPEQECTIYFTLARKKRQLEAIEEKLNITIKKLKSNHFSYFNIQIP